MDRLDELESRSIYVIREAYSQYRDVGLLWSIGKDSTTLLWLCRKAFLGKIPFPVIHIDTSYKFPQMYKFRDEKAKEWGLNLTIARNDKALADGMCPEKGRLDCCTQLKTDALKECIARMGLKAILLGIRRDEHGIRSKERYFCFPRGALVYGQMIKPIEDMIEGDFVFTHLGSSRKVLGVSSRHYNGELVKIIPAYGMPISITPNHVLLAKVPGEGKKTHKLCNIGFDGIRRELNVTLQGRRRIAWIRASDLREKDLIFIPKLPKKQQDRIKTRQYIPIREIIGTYDNLVKTQRQIYWKSAHQNTAKMRESLPLSPEMLRVIGYYVAEGSSNTSSNQISFAFCGDERNLVDEVVNVIRKNFSVEGKVRKRGYAFEITFSSKTLMLLFSKLCGRGARNRTLPFFYTQLSKKQLTELVKGCWVGDGSGERYSTMSGQLAHQLRLSMLRLGILVSIKKDMHSLYHLNVCGTSKNRFTRIFGIECKTEYIERCNHAREITEFNSSQLPGCDYGKSRAGGFWIPVRKIEKTGYDGIVYDLKVEGHSSYIVEGLAVHNSPRNEDFKWNYKDQPPELWDQYKTRSGQEQHVRVHPLLHWTELDVWEYVKREGIPVTELYFAKEGKRYRSIGCVPCCSPVDSNAATIDEIVEELKTTKTSERSGRAQDKETAYMMQKLRSLGYM
jgi:3'-phosphoadenosine 5'-phosphosulfate sulfotransferase (PAPS reductase)/FAD synthetase/intein/homing endonuclease